LKKSSSLNCKATRFAAQFAASFKKKIVTNYKIVGYDLKCGELGILTCPV
jgi:hypothetical protein